MSLRKPVLSAGVLDGAARALDDTHKSVITVVNPKNSSTRYDYTLKENVVTEDVILDKVRARIQPVRSATRRDINGNETEVKTFLIALSNEHNTANIKTGYKVTVQSTDIPTALTNYVLYVSDYANSTNPIERAFYCVMDQEIQNVP